MEGVHDRALERRGHREGRERRVDVEEVEGSRIAVHVQGVDGVEQWIVDQLGARSLVENIVELGLRLRVTRSEEGHVVPTLDEAIGQQGHDPLDASVPFGRHRQPGGSHLRDPHLARC